MSKKKKPAELGKKEFHVPFRVTVEGRLNVTATDAEEAKQIANSGDWDDPDFFTVAEIVDWDVCGTVREVG